MEGARPGVSVIVLTRNGGADCQEALRAVLRQRVSGALEVVLIDSSSTDGTTEQAERLFADLGANPRGVPLRVTIIDARDFGHGRTRNLGANLARGEILVYLVQDALPVGERFIEVLTAPLAAGDVAGCFGRQLARATAGPLEAYFLGQAYPGAGSVRAGHTEPSFGVANILFSNVCSAIRRAVWEKHRFADNLVMSEDQEWGARVIRAGHSIVYEPRAEVLHSHHYGLAAVFRRNFDSGMSLRQIGLDRSAAKGADGVRYLMGEAAHLVSTGRALRLPYMALYEGSRVAGFTLGRYHAWLPAALKPHLSHCRSYWLAKTA